MTEPGDYIIIITATSDSGAETVKNKYLRLVEGQGSVQPDDVKFNDVSVTYVEGGIQWSGTVSAENDTILAATVSITTPALPDGSFDTGYFRATEVNAGSFDYASIHSGGVLTGGSVDCTDESGNPKMLSLELPGDYTVTFHVYTAGGVYKTEQRTVTLGNSGTMPILSGFNHTASVQMGGPVYLSGTIAAAEGGTLQRVTIKCNNAGGSENTVATVAVDAASLDLSTLSFSTAEFPEIFTGPGTYEFVLYAAADNYTVTDNSIAAFTVVVTDTPADDLPIVVMLPIKEITATTVKLEGQVLNISDLSKKGHRIENFGFNLFDAIDDKSAYAQYSAWHDDPFYNNVTIDRKTGIFTVTMQQYPINRLAYAEAFAIYSQNESSIIGYSANREEFKTLPADIQITLANGVTDTDSFITNPQSVVVSGTVSPNSNELQNARLTVSSEKGSIVDQYDLSIQENGFSCPLDFSGYASGIYMISVKALCVDGRSIISNTKQVNLTDFHVRTLSNEVIIMGTEDVNFFFRLVDDLGQPVRSTKLLYSISGSGVDLKGVCTTDKNGNFIISVPSVSRAIDCALNIAAQNGIAVHDNKQTIHVDLQPMKVMIGDYVDIMDLSKRTKITESDMQAYTVNVSGISDDQYYIYLSQGLLKNTELLSGANEVRFGECFSGGEFVYLLLINKNSGESKAYKTNLTISKKPVNVHHYDPEDSTLKFQLGGETKFTIPESIPGVGGMEFSWKIPVPLSVGYTIGDDTTLKIVFGVNALTQTVTDKGVKTELFPDWFTFDDYKSKLAKKASKEGRTLKQIRNDFKLTNKDYYKEFFGGKFIVGGKINDQSHGIDVLGYAELLWTENGWVFKEGNIKLEATVKFSHQGQAFIWVIPLYYEASLSGRASTDITIKNIKPEENWTPVLEGSLSLNANAALGLGAGIVKVANLGVEGGLSTTLTKSLQSDYLRWDGKATITFQVTVLGQRVASREWKGKDWLIYETGNPLSLSSDSADASLLGMEALSEWTDFDMNQVYPNEDRSYNATPMNWSGSESSASLLEVDYTNRMIQTLADHVYPSSMPSVCECGDQLVMVMTLDHPDRTDIDRTALAWSRYDVQRDTWSAPQYVCDDGTADYSPCFRNGWLIWQNAKNSLDDSMTLAEIAAETEIVAARWNGSGFDAPVSLTENNYVDMLPCIAVEGNQVFAAWLSNDSNNLLGLSGTTSLWYAEFDGVGWSEPQLLSSGLPPVSSMSIGVIGNEPCIAYTADMDCDLNTIDDWEIYIVRAGETLRWTENETLDSNPQFAAGQLFFYSDSDIVYTTLNDSHKVFSEVPFGLTDDFAVSPDANAIWWVGTTEQGTELYASLFLGGAWNGAIKLTDQGRKAYLPSGVILDDGSILLAYQSALYDELNLVETSLFTLFSSPSYDIALVDAYFDESSMTAYAMIRNNGERMIDSFSLQLMEGSVINNVYDAEEPLRCGEEVEVALPYLPPEHFAPTSLHLSVIPLLPEGREEYNEENNTVYFEIGHPDPCVDNFNAVRQTNGEYIVSGEVINRGYDTSEEFSISIHKDGFDGEILDTLSINDLDVGETASVAFTVRESDFTFEGGVSRVYLTADYPFDEVSAGNNSEAVLLMQTPEPPEFSLIALVDAQVGLESELYLAAQNNTGDNYPVVIMCATYAETGKMLRSFMDTRYLTPGTNSISLKLPFSIGNGEEVKLFLLSEEWLPISQYCFVSKE